MKNIIHSTIIFITLLICSCTKDNPVTPDPIPGQPETFFLSIDGEDVSLDGIVMKGYSSSEVYGIIISYELQHPTYKSINLRFYHNKTNDIHNPVFNSNYAITYYDTLVNIDNYINMSAIEVVLSDKSRYSTDPQSSKIYYTDRDTGWDLFQFTNISVGSSKISAKLPY